MKRRENSEIVPEEKQSIVGLRSTWVCYSCGTMETTQQLARIGEHPGAPQGWTVADTCAYCRRCRQKAAA